jgi:hypothetical protein
MSRATIIWSMTASACLTLAPMNFLIWCRQRESWGNWRFTALDQIGDGTK